MSTPKSSRRILALPAVHPCPAAPPLSLLRSLIAISSSVSHPRSSPTTLPSLARPARHLTRHIASLHLVFDELLALLADAHRPPTPFLVLSLSELHVALQKVQFLLHDLCREGARMWTLVKSERFVDELHLALRGIATALDILPLASFNLDRDVAELAQLVAKQVRRVRIDVDRADHQALVDVRAVLGQLARGTAPDLGLVRRVLAHLGIRNWMECNKEVRFLEEELELESSEGEEKDAALLGSLIGLMCYCRAVVFDVTEGRAVENSVLKQDYKELSCLNPEDFRCSISFELMTDPVVVSTGQTYDRESILKWFKAGNYSCPKTGEKLRSTELVQNLALQSIIQKYLQSNGLSIPEQKGHSNVTKFQPLKVSVAATGAMRLLAVFLVQKLSFSAEAELRKASYECRLLTKTSNFNRSCLVEAGAVLSLLNLLPLQNASIQDNVAAALLNLSKHPKGKALIFESGGVKPILEVLQKGLRLEAKQNAAATLFYLASVDEYHEAIGEFPKAIPGLVGLIGEGTDRGKKNAVVALFGLLRFEGNHPRAIMAGAVPALVSLLASERADIVNDAVAVLAILAEKPEGSDEILRAVEVNSLVRVLLTVSSRTGREHCVSMLLALCVNGGADIVLELRKLPSLLQCLCLFLKEGSFRSSKKANLLIQILHDRHKQRSSSEGLLLSPLRQDYVVHVW